jgi:murein DD-endopeptidase MepM/ murein hydrolase activator NlpD
VLGLVATLAILATATHAGAQTGPGGPTTTTTATTSTTEPTTTSSTSLPTSSVPPSTDPTVPPPIDSTVPPDPSTSSTSTSIPADDPKQVIEAGTAGFDFLTPEELDLLRRFQEALDRINQLRADIMSFNDVVIASQSRLIAAQSRVRSLTAALTETEERLAEAETQLDDRQARLRTVAVQSYIGGGRDFSIVSVLMASKSVDELGKGRVYANAVAEDQRGAIEESRRLRDHIKSLRELAAEQQSEAIRARDALAAEEKQLESQQQQLLERHKREQEAVLEQAKVISEIDSKRLEFFQRQAGHLGSGFASSMLAARQIGQVPPAITTGIFSNPVPGARLTSLYGYRMHPLYGAYAFHPGIDLAIGQGTPIRAAMDGEVIVAEFNTGGYGNMVVIDHANGLGTLYAHASVLLVQVGQRVRRGDVIALVGSTGYSTGPHLHFEAYVGGTRVDPLPMIGFGDS